ncbi:MAG TPA: alkaline phosphatase family protein [Gemmatimonadaceae bacterium]|nr:alkaline phosphatase family protein [Gemmatimonadaceae bacterium]
MTKPSPVIAIGVDAAELSLIDRWCNEGQLPALQALRARGSWGVVESSADLYAGAVWPTFYSACEAPWHGIYHNKLWRSEHMRCEAPTDAWRTQRPFWEHLDRTRFRMAIVDVPFVLGDFRPLPGLMVGGWQSHDVREQGSYPSELWTELQRTHGASAMPPEYYGAQSAALQQRTADALVRAARQLNQLSAALLAREPWTLFLTVFGATHRAGHYLWDFSQIDAARLSDRERRDLQGALQRVYRECDQGVGELVSRAPDDARILVFALHGMGKNNGWADRCPDILFRILTRDSGTKPKRGLIYRVKKALPWRMVREVTTRLPHAVQHRLISIWSARMFDWRTTRAFPLPMDSAGFVRINKKGREPEGIVEPGPEYDALCEELGNAFLTFRDAHSGAPIVREVVRADRVAPATAPYRESLPDLLILWNDVSAIDCRAIRSDRYGEVRWEAGTTLPSGRSGNHLSRGWWMAAGPNIPRGRRVDGYCTTDLAPTIMSWLGAPLPGGFQGRPIPELCE